MGVVCLQHRCRSSPVCSPSLSTRYEIPAAVHVLVRVYSCFFVLLGLLLSINHKTLLSETIVKPRNWTAQPPRDQGQLLRWALFIHEAWNLHFLLDPTFCPTLLLSCTHMVNPTHKSPSALPGLHWCSCTTNAQNWRWQRWLAMWLSDWDCTEHA